MFTVTKGGSAKRMSAKVAKQMLWRHNDNLLFPPFIQQIKRLRLQKSNKHTQAATTTRLGNGELEHSCVKVGLGHYKDPCRIHKDINVNTLEYLRVFIEVCIFTNIQKYIRLIKATRMPHLAYTPFSCKISSHETIHSAPKGMQYGIWNWIVANEFTCTEV